MSAGPPDAFATFRPRRGRYVTIVIGAAVLALFVTGAIVMPGPAAGGNWMPGDRIMLVAFGVALGGFVWRYAAIRAVPTREALEIRNLVRSHRIEWSQVVAVNFSGGDPWPRLDLDDTEQVAVMAIQKSDGAYGRAEASRLAALVEALGTTEHPSLDT